MAITIDHDADSFTPSSGTIATPGIIAAQAFIGSLVGNADSATTLAGTLNIADGGTGQTTKTDAFDALSPLTSKGDLIVDNGTNNIRLPVGTNGDVLTADSSVAAGVKWAAPAAGGGGITTGKAIAMAMVFG